MRLIYTETGTEVKVGDLVETSKGVRVTVAIVEKPHKPSSTGRVHVQAVNATFGQSFFPSVIGAEWVEREDQVAV